MHSGNADSTLVDVTALHNLYLERPMLMKGLPRWFSGKEFAYQVGDLNSIPGRSLGEGNDNPLQYSCLENLMDRGAWQVTSCGVAKSRT